MRKVCSIVCLGACLGVLASGCGTLDLTVRRLARSGTQGAVQGLADNGAGMRAALRDVLLQDDVLQRIVGRATQGVIASLSEQEQKARIALLAAAMTDALKERGNELMQTYLRTAGSELQQTLEVVAADTLRRVDTAVKGLISQELTEATQQLIRKNAETLASVLAAELAGALGASLQQTSGQVAKAVVQEAVRELRSKESQDAVREVLHNATREAVTGAREGLQSELSGSRTQAALVAGLIGMGSLLLIFTAVLGFFVRQYLQSTKALAVIAQKINEVPEGGQRLKEAIHSGAERNRVHPWLSTFLKRHGL